jgi:hypothetical protein
LPGWLRAGTVQLGWKDLRLPAALTIVSVVLGLIIITGVDGKRTKHGRVGASQGEAPTEST